jgi:Holin of 3TMs, for gene-transfer release
MVLPLPLIVSLVSSLMSGPINKLLDAHIKDTELRKRLQAELEIKLTDHMGKSLELEQAIVLAEVKSEHWLSYSWRPILMLTLMGFLVLVGLVLPIADMLAGHPLPFNPRWQVLPPQFWEFLSIGVGGYIGGRSLEKIAGKVLSATPRK